MSSSSALTLSTPKTQTVQVAMAMTQGSTISPYNLQMAASLLTVAVPLLIFLFLGRYFIRGILAGASQRLIRSSRKPCAPVISATEAHAVVCVPLHITDKVDLILVIQPAEVILIPSKSLRQVVQRKELQ